MADRTTVKRPLSWPVVRIVLICSPALETVISPACPTTMVSHPCDQHRLEGTAGGTCRSFRVFMTNPTTCGNNGVRNLVTLNSIIPSWYEILWQSLANWSLPAKRELMMMEELCKPSPTCCEFCVIFTPSQLSSLPLNPMHCRWLSAYPISSHRSRPSPSPQRLVNMLFFHHHPASFFFGIKFKSSFFSLHCLTCFSFTLKWLAAPLLVFTSAYSYNFQLKSTFTVEWMMGTYSKNGTWWKRRGTTAVHDCSWLLRDASRLPWNLLSYKVRSPSMLLEVTQ